MSTVSVYVIMSYGVTTGDVIIPLEIPEHHLEPSVVHICLLSLRFHLVTPSGTILSKLMKPLVHFIDTLHIHW